VETEARSLAGGGRVLIVDDEQIVRNAAGASLRRHGYEILEASGGPEAIEIFRHSGASISLVLLDLTMPGMSGVDVMEKLQLIDNDVRVLLSSGFNEVEAVRRFTGKGLAGFIQKPYTSSALAGKVKEILDESKRPTRD
jgi:DNA-binding NtrC family response regulator